MYIYLYTDGFTHSILGFENDEETLPHKEQHDLVAYCWIL